MRIVGSLLFIGLSASLAVLAGKYENPLPGQVFIQRDRGTGFVPEVIQIPAGSTITWLNKENATWSVTNDKLVFTSADLEYGDSYSFTFKEAGVFHYHCQHDSGMRGTVVVR